MRQANVYCRGIFAGILTKEPSGYRFEYAPAYLAESSAQHPAISLSLPRQQDPFISTNLFPFFFGLLAEGDDKALQCRALKIDEADHFTRLVRTCSAETIGGVTIQEVP